MGGIEVESVDERDYKAVASFSLSEQGRVLFERKTFVLHETDLVECAESTKKHLYKFCFCS